MKKFLLTLFVLLGVLYNASIAEENNGSTRFEKQHKVTRFMEKHLNQSEMSLLLFSIDGNSIAARQQALQTLRELEWLFPEYPFDSALTHLGNLLIDKTADNVSRTLAALALDDLHSDSGDIIINNIANDSEDKGLQTICKALIVKSRLPY